MFTLMLVDDELWTLRDMEVLLGDVEGFRITGAFTDPLEAEQAILREAPDVVLTDLKMEEMDGQALIRSIHERCPRTRFIICSAYRNFDAARDAIRHNVIDYLLKPINKEEFLRIFDMAREQLSADSARVSAAGDTKYTRFRVGMAAEASGDHGQPDERKLGALNAEIPCPCRIEPLAREDFAVLLSYDDAETVRVWIDGQRDFGFSRERASMDDLPDMKAEARAALLAGFQYADSESMGGVQAYIALNYASRLTLGDVARHFNFATAYLSDSFHRKCGVTLFAFIKQVRIAMACDLLATTSRTVQEIALGVGYEDASHFCREFKRAKGVTTNEYRQGLRRARTAAVPRRV